MTILFKGQPILALGVYDFENNDPKAGSPLEGAYVVKLNYFAGEQTLGQALDLWDAAEAAAKVLGGNNVGLACLVGSSWYDTEDGFLLAPDLTF